MAAPVSIEPVIELATAYNAMLLVRDLHTVRMWVNAGCDVDKDVVPTMKQLTTRNAHITTFGYFTQAVYRARDRRLEWEKANPQTDATPQEVDIHRKARTVAHIVRRFAQVKNPDMERWLAAYEAEHGAVVL
ncbi:MAG TPA: hypothetical protein VD866_06345 [Urbifossiella sp.]|nr:hypothetical protein [Urbifossiella sp.]